MLYYLFEGSKKFCFKVVDLKIKKFDFMKSTSRKQGRFPTLHKI